MRMISKMGIKFFGYISDRFVLKLTHMPKVAQSKRFTD